jgi:hypothetical protein
MDKNMVHGCKKSTCGWMNLSIFVMSFHVHGCKKSTILQKDIIKIQFCRAICETFFQCIQLNLLLFLVQIFIKM